MFAFLSDFLEKNQIDLFGVLPLSACCITKPYLLEREGIKEGSVLIMAVPYYTPAAEDRERNLSAYAVPRDYHHFFEVLFNKLLSLLKEIYPQYRFAAFADHSPIAEIEAAARAGLGVIGKNGLLLTEKYSSYVFLGELVTDAILPNTQRAIEHCAACSACLTDCPKSVCGTCLSSLTQKKGELTDFEKQWIKQYGSVWGCDICQEVCPYTKRAKELGSIYSPISYFKEDTISHLTEEQLINMTEEEFSQRAFAWRGKDTIRRNLILIEERSIDEC